MDWDFSGNAYVTLEEAGLERPESEDSLFDLDNIVYNNTYLNQLRSCGWGHGLQLAFRLHGDLRGGRVVSM